MTVRLYQSTDASAPVLYGSVGSLTALLRACLVAGYGSGSPQEHPAAGWSEPFSESSNQTAFQMGVGGSSYYLNVNDNGPGAGGAREARLTGYETMSAPGSGTNPFPTTSQLATGAVYCRKSATADGSNARSWILVADEHFFSLMIHPADYSNPTRRTLVCFGDIISYKPSTDPYRCILIGRQLENQSSAQYEPFGSVLHSAGARTTSGHFMARFSNGTNISAPCGKIIPILLMGPAAGSSIGDVSTSGTGVVGDGEYVSIGEVQSQGASACYPQQTSGGLNLSRIFITHSNGDVRGHLRGLWAPLHANACNDLDAYSGAGNLNGRSFLPVKISVPVQSNKADGMGEVHVETSDTWD